MINSLCNNIPLRSSVIIPQIVQLNNIELETIIENNEYIKKCKSNNKKDCSSLSFLIDRIMSQSDCIKLGTSVELVLKDIIVKTNKNINDIRPKNTKGKKERDHLFMNEDKKTIFYAEIKSNLNLDTEKCKSTSQKCLQIKNELKNEYPEHEIKMFLIGSRYLNKSFIPKNIIKKYNTIDENVLGINDYFRELEIPFSFENEELYSVFLNKIANKMFD